VNDTILLELKSAKTIADEHIAQTLNYLKATGIRLAIILNFGPDRLEHKRLVM
jgi:GxxExxY protein